MPLLGPNGQPIPAQPSPAEPKPSTPTQEETPQPPARVVTAFLVFQLPNGQWAASEDIFTPIVPSRAPQPDDLIGGAENIKQQVIAQKTASLTAMKTVETQMSVAAQIQQAQEAELVKQHIERTRSRG